VRCFQVVVVVFFTHLTFSVSCFFPFFSLFVSVPLLFQSSPYVDKMNVGQSMSLYGNRAASNVLLDPNAIMIAGQTTREGGS